MCGIAGVWRGQRQADDRQVVSAMLAELRSRGPDSKGLAAEGPVVLGHRRLAILDLSDAGRQPMTSHSGRYVVSLNGEIFNFAEVRDELRLRADAMRSSSDTEILLEAWERWGEGCLSHLVGPFAFAMFDRRERRLWLVRDRVGEKPLFWHRAGGVVAFASSIPALLQATWISPELDDDRLAEYLTLRYTVAPRTVLRGVEKLRPGHLVEISERGVEVRRWWWPRFDGTNGNTRASSAAAMVEEFDAHFRRACRRCLVSDVPVGMLLSDGIDSHAVQNVIASNGVALSAYTFQAAASSPQEAPRTDGNDRSLQVRTFSPDAVLAQLEPALSRLTEPVGDGSALATWLLIRSARKDATVFLCGHGGDEVLGGYRLSQERFRMSMLRLLCRLPLSLSAPAVEFWTHGAGPVAERRRAFAGSGAGDWPAAVPYLIHRPLFFSDLQALFGGSRDPHRFLASIDRLYGECPADLTDLDRMQYVLLETFFAANILSFADSVSMDSSAELRMPFVDRDLLQFVLSLPRAMRVSRWPGTANTKLLLRHWARGRLPADVVRRKKRTFNYGSIRHLLREGSVVRDRILGQAALRRRLPGLEAWVSRNPEFFRRSREGTLWALLSLAVWGDAVGIH